MELMMLIRRLSRLYFPLTNALILLVLVMQKPSPTRAATTPPPSSSNSTDLHALRSFRSLITTGNALDSWNDPVRFCNWYGVTCGARHPERVVGLSLEYLNLGGTISPSLGNLTFLQRLHLPANNLHGLIPQELGRLRRLQYLNLSTNSLQGEIPESLSHLSSLQVITLSLNKLQGSIPANLSRCSNLQIMVLRNNTLSGIIPPEFGSLPKINILNLRNNYLSGSIPPSLGNISTLTQLYLGFNNLQGSIPAELAHISGINVIDLLYNNLSGKIPTNLYNLSSLAVLGVGGNQLTGTLPPDFGMSLPKLDTLYMYSNRLEGQIPLSIVNASSLSLFDLTNNSFTGPVPSNLGSLSQLTVLHLDANQFEANGDRGWSFITSLTNCSYLEELGLMTNNFSGSLPPSIANLSSTLYWLTLTENKITGRIPLGLGDHFTELSMLDLSMNSLSGPIPSSFGKLSALQGLYLEGNKLSGEIPSSIGNLTHVVEFNLSVNYFSGSIPGSFEALQKLEFLDLSYNNLTGDIPKGVLGIASISQYLNMSHNALVGSLSEEIGSLINLQALDVSENKLSSRIPSSLGNCELLDYLNLQGNHFNGTIPDQLSNLKGIQILDLSENQLSGPIPRFLETLTTLQYLNLSFNDFEGEVPTEGIFSNLSSFSIQGNNRLCGGNPKLNLQSCTVKKYRLTIKVVIIIICLVVLCCSLLMFCLLCKYCRVHKYYPIKILQRNSSLKDQFLKVTYTELSNATDGFSPANLIGSGGFGAVYKGLLERGNMEIAVKVLNRQIGAASKSFMAECKVLRNVRHRNLVRIITSCSTVDPNGNEFKALIYEFMPNGSLERWLHADLCGGLRVKNLDLFQRLGIAFDVASALDYLHNQTETPIVHCDLKPSNILLDNEMTAHLSDFGIARFLLQYSETASVGIKGSIGYIAPECGMGRPISTAWDVYSYGILLLEMFTGKRPTDDVFMDGLSLRAYVEESFPEHIMNIVDSQCLPKERDDKVRKAFQEIMRTGLKCSHELPRERMQMKDVIKKLDDIKKSLLETEGYSKI